LQGERNRKNGCHEFRHREKPPGPPPGTVATMELEGQHRESVGKFGANGRIQKGYSAKRKAVAGNEEKKTQGNKKCFNRGSRGFSMEGWTRPGGGGEKPRNVELRTLDHGKKNKP